MSANQREDGGAKDTEILGDTASEHQVLLFKCRMAENSERFDDMVKYIKEACMISAAQAREAEVKRPPVGPSERNYLSVAYKNSVGIRRNALRCLQAMRNKYEAKKAAHNVAAIDEYYKTIHDEMRVICCDVLDLIDNVILRHDAIEELPDELATREFRVFFHKMHGDYCRYLAEFNTGEGSGSYSNKKDTIEHAAKDYALALDIAKEGPEKQILPPSHPIRLGLCLNYSVFLYEIQEKPEEAKALAKQAFDDALDNIDSAGELEYKDSTLILQLLRDNSALWGSQDNDGNAGHSPAAAPADAEKK